MNITGLFIRRPVMTLLLSTGVLLFGLLAYRNLPLSFMPEVEFPTIQVRADLAGASPETMAATVASPLEREFAGIAGVVAMSSTNTQGRSEIVLQFDLDRDIDNAAMDVQSAMTKAARKLPSEMDTPPSLRKLNPADTPVLYIALTSPTLHLSKLTEYAKTFLTRSISTLPGVAQINVYGERNYAVRIRLDPRVLASMGLGIDEVRQAVVGANVDMPLGALEGDKQNVMLQTKGQLYSAEEYRPLVVASLDNQPVRLEDLGSVEDGSERERFSAWHDGEQSLVVAVQRQPGSNIVEVVDGIRAALPGIQAQMPGAVDMRIIRDLSQFVRESVSDVKFTLLLAVVMVTAVVFAFLRSISGTIIAATAIPFAMIATFAAMLQMQYTLDSLSLMALVLAVGFVVDDAIVVLENVVRHAEMGKPPMQAALEGSREISFTIVSMTLSLAAVFIPVLFMSGIIGRVFHEFAVTLAVAVLLSGVVALTLSPMLCSRILSFKETRRHHAGGLYSRVLGGYERLLRASLRHKGKVMFVAGLVLAATLALFLVMPKGFLPEADQGYLRGFTEARQGISYQSMLEHQKALIPIVRDTPGMADQLNIIGIPQQNQGRLFYNLAPSSERDKSAMELKTELMSSLNQVPGLQVYVTNPPMINIGARSSRADYQFTLLSPDTGQLYEAAPGFEKALAGLPELTGVSSDMLLSHPQLDIDIDRDKAAMLGVSIRAIEDALYTAYGERKVSSIRTAQDEYSVIMELLPEFQTDPRALSMLYVRAASGQLVRLDALATVRQTLGPAQVNHTGQLPSVTYSFNASPGVPLSAATAAVEYLAAHALPDTISTRFEGTAQAFQDSMASMGGLLLLAVAVIYIILGCLYESFLHPLTILSGIPSAALGGVIALALFGMDLDLFGFLGVILLIGIVKKNSIMVVDFAIAEEKRGASPEEAALRGSLIRFRPIVMTTMAAMAGALPIAVGYGAGGEARQPLGIVVVGGLILSQLVTLFLTPVFYSYMARLQHRLARRTARA